MVRIFYRSTCSYKPRALVVQILIHLKAQFKLIFLPSININYSLFILNSNRAWILLRSISNFPCTFIRIKFCITDFLSAIIIKPLHIIQYFFALVRSETRIKNDCKPFESPRKSKCWMASNILFIYLFEEINSNTITSRACFIIISYI